MTQINPQPASFNDACLVLNTRVEPKRFALVSVHLGRAMIGVGNTGGFHALTCNPKPERIVLRQVRPGLCAVDISAGETSLTHESGRWEARRLADYLSRWTGAPVFNRKKTRRGQAGSVVRVF